MEDWLVFHESLWRQFSISTNFTTTNNKWAKFLQQQQQKNQCWWKVNLKKYDLMVIIVQLTNGIAWSRISSFDTSKIHSIIQYIKRQRKYEKWFHIDINFNHIHHQYSRHKFSPFVIIGWINWVWNQEISILLTIFVLPKTLAILLSSGVAVGYLYI